MMKRILPLLCGPFLLAGCSSVFTNLTPLQQARTTNNLYHVEVAFTSQQQTIRWHSIKPKIIVGSSSAPIEMVPTALMSNRWEGLVPVPPGANSVEYRYRFDYDCNAFGKPKQESSVSHRYTLHIYERAQQ